MIGDDLKVTDGATAGAWIELRLEGSFASVTSTVPQGYEAYARVFHPASDAEGNPVTWAEVAERLGTTAHREMQWHALIGLPDSTEPTGSKWSGSDPSLGAMDLPILDALCEILAVHTADPAHCFFGLCTIQSWEDSFSANELRQPYLKLPLDRDHIVLAGPLSATDQIARDWSKSGSNRGTLVAFKGEGQPSELKASKRYLREAPNLIWPKDRSWLVASEVDFDSTLVGGDVGLIQAIVSSPKLEAWEVQPTDSLAYDADKVNAYLT